MRVMVFAKAPENVDMTAPPTPEMLEAFAAMDKFTEELVQAGVFVAAAGLQNGSQSKRILFEGRSRTVIDGPFAVKDMDEAVAWAKRAPSMPGKSEMEIRPFYEPEDLAAFMTPEELAAPRTGDRGKLGVA
jgi:hypothetical protein